MNRAEHAQQVRYSSQFNSPFAAVLCAAATARQLAQEKNIPESAALCNVIYGRPAEKPRPRSLDAAHSVFDRLNYVDDDEVVQAVRDTISLAFATQKFQFLYNGVKCESRRSRIRVLSRMIWDELNNPG